MEMFSAGDRNCHWTMMDHVCERVPGRRTSYREGAAAVRGPVVAWNDDQMTSEGL